VTIGQEKKRDLSKI